MRLVYKDSVAVQQVVDWLGRVCMECTDRIELGRLAGGWEERQGKEGIASRRRI